MLKDNCRSFQNQQVAAVLSKKLGTSPLAKEQPFFSLKKISKMGVQGHFWGGGFSAKEGGIRIGVSKDQWHIPKPKNNKTEFQNQTQN